MDKVQKQLAADQERDRLSSELAIVDRQLRDAESARDLFRVRTEHAENETEAEEYRKAAQHEQENLQRLEAEKFRILERIRTLD